MKQAAANLPPSLQAHIVAINRAYPGAGDQIINRVKEKLGSHLAAIGEDTNNSWGASLRDLLTTTVQTAKEVLPAYYQAKTQERVTNAQLKRMERGLPPADVSAYQAPPMVIQHSVDPRAFQNTFAMDPQTKQWLIVGGLAVAGLLLFRNA